MLEAPGGHDGCRALFFWKNTYCGGGLHCIYEKGVIREAGSRAGYSIPNVPFSSMGPNRGFSRYHSGTGGRGVRVFGTDRPHT